MPGSADPRRIDPPLPAPVRRLLRRHGIDPDRAVRDRRGRARIFLGKRHPYAQSSGQQWVYRLVVMLCLGRPLLGGEQVHHADGDPANDRPSNLMLVLAEYHGRLHCALHPESEIRGRRLVALSRFGRPIPAFRLGAVLSSRPLPRPRRDAKEAIAAHGRSSAKTIDSRARR